MKQGWTYKTLGEIATSMYRGSGIRRDQVTNDGIPCVRYGEIYTTYNISFNECVSHTQELLIPNPKYFEHGDLLFAITGESVEDIGKTIAYLGKEKCLLGGDIICMKHNENPKYLSYALSTPDAIRQKGLGKTKLKVVHTNAPSLQSIKIPLPSPAEQERIVERLDAAFAQIDELKSNAERQLAEARALFQSALTQAMQPKSGWQDFSFSQIIKLKSGDNLPAKSFVEGAYPVYGGNGIAGYHNQYNKEGGQIVIGRVGALCGNVRLIKSPFWLTDNGFEVTLDKEHKMDLPFLTYLLNFCNLRQYARQAAQPVISNVSLKDIQLNIPPLSEQQVIVEHLDALSNHVKELEEINRKTATECDALKQALLRQIFE